MEISHSFGYLKIIADVILTRMFSLEEIYLFHRSVTASKTKSLPALQTPCYIEWIEVTDVFHFLILIFTNIKESPRAHSYSCGISIVNSAIIIIFTHNYDTLYLFSVRFLISGSLYALLGRGAIPKPTNNAGRCLKLKD